MYARICCKYVCVYLQNYISVCTRINLYFYCVAITKNNPNCCCFYYAKVQIHVCIFLGFVNSPLNSIVIQRNTRF